MKRILSVCIVVVLVTSMYDSVSCYAAKDELSASELYSLSAVLIDGDTGRVLYEKNAYEVRPMASTTKIMTLIIALEYGNRDDIVTVSSYAAKMPDVQLGICEGEQYRMSDLMYSLMLESHNDSAVAIAEHVGGSLEGFADMMNDKVRELGLEHTYFITPNGLDAEDSKGKHSTCAADLALVMRYCIKESPASDKFIEICRTRNHSFTDYEGKRSFSVNNKNRFLDMMDGVIAGKTGFTADAGYCYVGAMENNGRTYIIALLACGWPNNKNYKWQDAKKLFAYGMDNYSYKTIVDESYKLPDINVKNGISADKAGVYIKGKTEMLLSPYDNVDIRLKLSESIEAPVKKGEIVGSLDIYVNDAWFTSKSVYCADNIERINYKYYLNMVVYNFLFMHAD